MTIEEVLHRSTYQTRCPACGRTVVIDHQTTVTDDPTRLDLANITPTVHISHVQPIEPACRWYWEAVAEREQDTYTAAVYRSRPGHP